AKVSATGCVEYPACGVLSTYRGGCHHHPLPRGNFLYWVIFLLCSCKYPAHEMYACKDASEGEHYRAKHIKSRRKKLPTLKEQHGFQRKGRKSSESTQQTRGQEHGKELVGVKLPR